jgi:urease accessory protein
MERVVDILHAGHWPAAEQRDSITLAYDDRHRRRLVMRAEGGTEFLLDLPEAAVLREGDGLRLAGGGYVGVRAAAEALIEVTVRSRQELARLAWHLGNRHLQTQIEDGRILIRRDHVIADMLCGLGATIREVMAPFDPESGAYSGGQSHHDHDHGHGHDHDHHHAQGHRGRGH